ncbi:type I restriction-modification system subunit M [Pseudarthrobacter sulfonivorans]|uniref:type I restriction-modification system subunit M n=1 Tax=Pseudarthrobacter sulfonivorans TaxID=121292 RepID=UPI00285BC62D|nr:type I restriction-modification system subunit M [Pseudarthrobacter sulfonivorans]MDR6413467.1 type I restriction enzyme M protein [Pseudarthrobacter sulfonivorans]
MTGSTESGSTQGVRAVALKKSDLYSSLWKSCDELRGGMDASQYKDYILTMLFVKYVSDKFKTDPDSLIVVPVGGSFDDMIAAKGDKEIGDRINKIIANLAEANSLQKVIDLADFNDEEKLGKGKEIQDRLSKLVTIFQDLDFRGSRAEGDDLLGDAYEYLMRHFATESGKSKGQFYTPAEVSRILAKLLGINAETQFSETAYDPTCGSGSLLLKVGDEAPNGLTLYGQEKDNATWALSKMNMILHGNEIADIRKGDTITSPQFTKRDQLEVFDFVVANPPFSVKSWSNGLENEFGRFEYGRPPEKNGDYAFLLHILKSMKSTGKAAVILPHGVLFRGNAEAAIRKRLLKQGFIKGIIGLPGNLFYGTGIPACIIVLDKENAAARTGVFMIDASKGFIKDGNKNRLRSQDLHKIVDVFTKQTELERYSRMVPLSEIADDKNDYNLNIPRYIDSSEPEDIQDLQAHIHGGIPERDVAALAGYWDAFPTFRSTLFQPNRPGYSDLAIDVADVQQTILDSMEFKQFAKEIGAEVDNWFGAHRARLEAITEDTKPNALIAELGEDLLARFRHTPLLDEYRVYEQLMSYWHDVMHDDVFLIMNDGWAGAATPRKTIDDKERKLAERPDLVIGSGRSAARYKMDLISPALVVARYFAAEQIKLDELAVAAEEASRSVEEYTEAHAVDEGLLADAMDDDKITKVLATARLRAARREATDPEEVKALEHLVGLYDSETATKKAVKEAQVDLDLAALKKYGDLEAEEIKQLVLDDKWRAAIGGRIAGEVDGLTLGLVARIQELGGRYAATTTDLDSMLSELEGRVSLHLAKMGIK